MVKYRRYRPKKKPFDPEWEKIGEEIKKDFVGFFKKLYLAALFYTNDPEHGEKWTDENGKEL